MEHIKIDNLSYSYNIDEKKVLNNINLSINKGEIVLIVGESGSGKSSLLKTLTGAIPHFYGGEISGKVLFEGKALSDMPVRDRAKKVAMVFQSPESQIIMDKVHREVAFSLENLAVSEKSIKRRVFEALQFLNILDIAYEDIENLSGGEKQKVVLASVLAMKSDVIILDEPTSQLDPQSSEELINLVKKINMELGKTIIIVEQKIDYTFDIADKIVVMKEGNVDFVGSRQDLYRSNYEEFLPMYLKIAKKLRFEDVDNIRDVRRKLNEYIKGLSNVNILSDNTLENNNEILKLSNLNVIMDNKKILKNINLSFNQGRIYSIVGENGAGKSTLLKSIMNLVKHSGDIIYNKSKISRMKVSEIAKNIGYVSQNPNDYISKDTVFEEIKFTLDNFGIYNYLSIEKVLTELEIYHLRDKNPRDLSEGEKERVAIASVLVMNSNILLLDEPSKGLDYKNKRNLGKILKRLSNEGKTIIMVSHDIDYVAEYSDEIILLLNGEVIDKGITNDILREGIYYTSTINKLSGCDNIFTLEDLINEKAI